MQPQDDDDPNAEALKQIAVDLAGFTDAQGRKLEISTMPSPGQVLSATGEVLPASYANFYIGNRTVVVPTYGAAADAEAVATIAKLFPERQTVGCPAWGIVHGGGAFHCITQQQI
jgi:agmatine deiminase